GIAALAWTGSGANTYATLSTPYTVDDGQTQGNIPLGGGTTFPICQAVLAGHNLDFQDEHNVKAVQASVTGQVGADDQGTITATAVLRDGSGNNAVNPTAVGCLIAALKTDPGFMVQSYEAQDSGYCTIPLSNVPQGRNVIAVTTLLTGFAVQYPGDDHH